MNNSLKSVIFLLLLSRGGTFGGKKPLPQEPPYLAFVGNLPQGVVQGDVIKIFDHQTVKGVRLVKDRDTDHFKGFCYVEFESLKDLEEALELDGRIQLEGFSSPLRIDVAEQKKERGNFNNKRGPIQRQNSGNQGGNNFSRGGNSGGRPFNDDRRQNDSYGGGGGRDFDRNRDGGGRSSGGSGGSGGGGSFGGKHTQLRAQFNFYTNQCCVFSLQIAVRTEADTEISVRMAAIAADSIVMAAREAMAKDAMIAEAMIATAITIGVATIDDRQESSTINRLEQLLVSAVS